MITINNKDVADIVIDNKNVVKVQDANTLEIMWEKTSPTPANEYFYIENTYSGNNVITVSYLTYYGVPPSNTYTTTLQYSKDKLNWTTITPSLSGVQINMSQNEKVYFRNDNGLFNYADGSVEYSNTFTASQSHSVGGNLISLVNYNNVNNLSLQQGCFSNLFIDDTKLTDASNLICSQQLSRKCFYHMFYGCTALTTSPSLPATTLTELCYQNMFENCTALTTAPTLSATSLAKYCYSNMFKGCIALTTAPTLPATTLTQFCYNSMFENCTALTTAPTLPATTVVKSCYSSMFYGCTSLRTAPSLPATTLGVDCYNSMFRGCTRLTTAPTLPATTLVTECYYQMFYGCSRLNDVTTYANDISATNCLGNWLNNVASTGTFHNLGSAVYPTGTSGIPSGWTEVHS